MIAPTPAVPQHLVADAEFKVAAALLNGWSPDEEVGADLFTQAALRSVHAVVATLQARGLPVDLETVEAESFRAGTSPLEQEFLAAIAEMDPRDPGLLRYNLTLLRDAATARRRAELADHIRVLASDGINNRSAGQLAGLLEEYRGGSAASSAAPLFDPAAARFDRFLRSDPPPRRMIVPEFLPLNVVGLLASMGGAGKSMFLYQLGLYVAAGLPVFGMPIGEVGSVLSLAAEDDEDELHRRGRRLLEHTRTLGFVDTSAVSERLHVVSRVAEDNLLTAGREGEVARTRLVDQLIAAARAIPHLKLILIDPVSRFRGGRANSEEDTTAFVTALEAIRAATGATVLAAVHVNKASIRDGDEADQSIVRGSTALVDGVRWCATMQRLRRDQALDYDVDPSEARHYVRLDLVKSNYTAPWPGMWLRRQAGGVLVPVELEQRADARKEAKADARYEEILGRVQRLLQAHGPLSANAIETKHAGQLGTLGVGQFTVRTVLGRAVDAGDLVRRDREGKGGGSVLDLPGGAE